MKRILAILALGLCLTWAVSAANESSALPLRRLALFVGSNNGGPGRATLRYAEEDARAMASLMQELGGVSSEDSLVLLAPTSQQLLESFQSMGRRAREAQAGSRRVEFLLYYSGHSDEQGLLVGTGRLDYLQLRSSIQEVRADVNIAILDSCSSGAFTRLKGGTRQPPFLVDESSQMKGHAYLTSTSADEAAQESDAINGSFFTHYLISGMRGAADATHDGQISLNEVYHYAFAETLARTEKTQAGPQHPSYNIQLTGSGDLTLTDLRAASCALLIEEGLEGRLFIRDARGRLVVELRVDPGVPVDLGLPEGRYAVTLDQGRSLYRAAVVIGPGSRQTLDFSQFSPVRRQRTFTRGAERAEEQDLLDYEQALEAEPPAPEPGADLAGPGPGGEAPEPEVTRVPFNFGLLPFLSSAGPGRHEYAVSLNLLVGSSYAIRGLEVAWIMNLTGHQVLGYQAAGVGNILNGRLAGAQSAGVFNIVTGEAKAAQWAGVFNIVEGRATLLQEAGVFNINRGEFRGAQGAGVFNIDDGPLYGLQAAGVFNVLNGPLAGAQAAGVFNRARNVSGAQVGLVNVCEELRGTQVGLVNIATGEARGVQVGLVNVSRRQRGVPVGLLNIVDRGEFHFSGWYSEDDMGYLGLQMIGGYGYTLLYWGTELSRAPSVFAGGLGLGLHLPLGRFFVDTDLSVAHVFQGPVQEWGDGFLTSPLAPVFPVLRLAAGLRLFGPLALFGGVSLLGHVPGGTVATPLHSGKPLDLGSGRLLLYPKLIVGLRL
jgi:hypothetical protein